MSLPWKRISEAALLKKPLQTLPLRVDQGPAGALVKRLYAELEAKGIRFKPPCWFGEEWFSPDGTPGISIPFFLANTWLMKLERKFMLEVEGGTSGEFMRILRHEAGHALDTAFRLHFRKGWRETFGSFAKPYPVSYRPRPNSRQHVLHLQGWYAQAHPAEDFAETFAVWLRPNSHWRRRYAGWPALKKLNYIDELMREIAGRAPVNRKRKPVEPISESRLTLEAYYEAKRTLYSLEWPAYYDRSLRRVFSENPRHQNRLSAAMFFRHERRRLCEAVSDGTGLHSYTLNHMIEHMVERCKALKLRMKESRSETYQQALVMVTFEAMNVIHSGHYKLAL